MKALSEKLELLGKDVYADIPGTITIKSIPTASELEFVSSEDFEQTMLDSIFPQAIEEDIPFSKLLEIDFNWICRCLRILNYGPYHTTNAIFCADCSSVSNGEYSVDLRNVDCKPLPPGFVNDITISKNEFIMFDQDIHIRLLTIQDALNSQKDKAFKRADGKTNIELARICYMISSIGTRNNLTPVERKMYITQNLCDADYQILKQKVSELSDYGLRAGGSTFCPKCKSKDAKFLALVNDKFFRPTLGDLKRWRDDRNSGSDENSSRDKATTV